MIRIQLSPGVSRANELRQAVAECSSLGLLTVGLAALYGWSTNNEHLAQFWPNAPAMQLASSILAIVVSVCLFILASSLQAVGRQHVLRAVTLVYCWFYALFSAEFWGRYFGAVAYAPSWAEDHDAYVPSLGTLFAYLAFGVYLIAMTRHKYILAKRSLTAVLLIAVSALLGTVIGNRWLAWSFVTENNGVPPNTAVGMLCMFLSGRSVLTAAVETEIDLAKS